MRFIQIKDENSNETTFLEADDKIKASEVKKFFYAANTRTTETNWKEKRSNDTWQNHIEEISAGKLKVISPLSIIIEKLPQKKQD